MINRMDFLTQVEVSILPYLRTLMFMEKETPCTMMTMREHAIDAKNLTRLESSTENRGGWLEEGDNRLAKD